MTDKFTCLPFDRLLNWIKKQEKTGDIFGISDSLFFRPSPKDGFRMVRYGRTLETPVGVAAGPHTQLSQNIISSWLTGARYIELKTVQVLDELELTRPCIFMQDEGYNCEWSQELKLEQSFDEYLNALVVIHILKRLLKTGDTTNPGFIFNMSVGYDFEGILSPRVQWFLDAMENSTRAINEKLDQAKAVFPFAADLDIPGAVSDNITLSTMHGCPPDEIERIGKYFIKQRKKNITVKLNPTLLGQDAVRKILNKDLQFDVTVPDLAFDHDLKFEQSVLLIKNLLNEARKAGVEFNLKLSNTLETVNTNGVLPENESMVYMSGRPLHAISINLAAKLQKEFNGDLDISFSAGADCFNLADILSCGLKPVTVCTDLLKPGGYGRLSQYLEQLTKAFEQKGARNLSQFICTCAGQKGNEKEAALTNLLTYADKVRGHERYRKKAFPYNNIKTSRKLTLFDCVAAPCKGACPAGQDVSAYMFHTAKGDFDKALAVILRTNPFAHLQGLFCSRPCTRKCTRINYDVPLKIREIKRVVAENSLAKADQMQDTGHKAAVIGGGPLGFSTAYFLRICGFEVELFESRSFGRGKAAHAPPGFPDHESVAKDIDRIVKTGVRVRYGTNVDQEELERIQKDFDYVYAGGDAWPGTLLKAIAEGHKVAQQMAMDAGIDLESVEKESRACLPDPIAPHSLSADHTVKIARRIYSEKKPGQIKGDILTREWAMKEADRCLSCDTVCNICTTVCPNRANIGFSAKPFKADTFQAVFEDSKTRILKSGVFGVNQAHQVINIADFCNECGNCVTFCPTAGAPYKDKPKFYLSKYDFDRETSGWFIQDNYILYKRHGHMSSLTEQPHHYVFKINNVKALFHKQTFEVINIEQSGANPIDRGTRIDLSLAPIMGYLYAALKSEF